MVKASVIWKRVIICVAVVVMLLLGFYLSLLASSSGLNIEQKHTVRKAIALVREKGFIKEARLLELDVYRDGPTGPNSPEVRHLHWEAIDRAARA